MSVFKGLLPGLPIHFVWLPRDDRDGLKRYIDSLLLGRKTESTQIEQMGCITEVEYDLTPRSEDSDVQINAHRLVDFLALRDHFNVPLWGKVRFVTNGKHLVPYEYIAAMSKLAGPYGAVFDAAAPWKKATPKDLEAMGLKPEDVTSSMYRFGPTSDTGETHAQEPAAPPREEQISMTHFRRHFEILTQSFPEGQRTFFTRRLFLYSGKQLWVGTAFAETGPWKVWERATSELIALGLTPD
jgi:hypothetical protein